MLPILAIAAGGIFAGTMLLVTDLMAGFYVENFFDLAAGTPGFDYSLQGGTESGNATFGAYAQLRLLATAALLCVMLAGFMLRILEARDSEAGIAAGRTVPSFVAKPAAIIVFLYAFPMAWDMGTDAIDGAAAWIINPLYSFDPDRPCPAEWYADTLLMANAYNTSPYTAGNVTAGNAGTAESVCSPNLRVEYLVSQALRGTDYESYKPDDPLMQLFDSASNFGTEAFANQFFTVAKALVAAQLILTTMVALVIVDVFTGVVIAAMPVFAAVSMAPRFSKTADKFLEAVPGLALLPVLSSVVVVVGSSFVAAIPDTEVGFVVDAGPIDLGVFYTWVAAVGVLFLAGGLPVMVVPIIGGVVGQAAGVVRSGMSTGAFVAGTAAHAAQSARGGAGGNKPGGNKPGGN